MLYDFYPIIKFGNMIDHQLNLHGLFLHITWETYQFIFSLEKLLMFFLIHSQVFLRVTLDCIFLIFNHWFLHGHKLTDRISFEGIEKMLKSIPKMLCILIYYLWHNLSLLFMFIMNRFADYFFCVRLLWYIFFKRYFFIVRCLIKYT